MVVSPLLKGTVWLAEPGRVSSRTSSAVLGALSFIVVVRASSWRLRARSVAESHLRQVGLVDTLVVAVVGLGRERAGRHAELAGHVLVGRVEPVDLGQGSGGRVEDREALRVLAVVGSVGIEDVVLVDQLSARVGDRAAETGQPALPVRGGAVDRARGLRMAAEVDDRPTARRDLGAEHRRSRATHGQRGCAGGQGKGEQQQSEQSAHVAWNVWGESNLRRR